MSEPLPGDRHPPPRSWLNLGEGFRVAVEAIRSNKVRSGLTILGVAVGVGVVVLMAAFITGLRTTIQESFQASGPTNFVINRFDFTAARRDNNGNGRPPWWNRPVIVPAEADRVDRLASVQEALYNVQFTITADFDGQHVTNIQSAGHASGWPNYTEGDFVAGRNFTPAEVRQSRALVVLSSALAEELFGYRDPIGRLVGIVQGNRTLREEFTVVGVFEPAPNIFTTVIKHWAVVPYTAAIKRLKASDRQAQILIVPMDSIPLLQVQDEVIGVMRSIRGLGPRTENNFALIETAQILSLFNRFTAMIFLVMLALTSAALMVGGVGVIGIMLISVTERTREIGVRKAVGATRREILWQFLVEATLLTVAGAAVGMAVGSGAAALVSSLTPLPARVPLWAVVTALAMATVTGMLFGLLPALRASRLEPVAALRHE
jgi:putative ABC transport system permease protein